MILLATKRAKRWIETINPANGKILRRFRASTRTDVEKSVEKARKAFEKWRELSPSKRADFLQRAAKILRSRKEKLGRIMTIEMGKTIKESVPEVAKCAWALEYFAENGPRFLNPETAKTDATDSYVAFEPLGVIGSIMPWNFPLWQCVRFAAPSLMAANTAAISFTGSVPAGQDVAKQASSQLKKVVLELGGSDPFIVLEDADVEASSTGAVAGRFINNGQSCICAKRFFVAKTIADEF